MSQVVKPGGQPISVRARCFARGQCMPHPQQNSSQYDFANRRAITSPPCKIVQVQSRKSVLDTVAYRMYGHKRRTLAKSAAVGLGEEL